MEFFELPTMTEIVSSTAPQGMILFNAMLPIVWFAISVTLGVVAIRFLQQGILWGLGKVSGHHFKWNALERADESADRLLHEAQIRNQIGKKLDTAFDLYQNR